MIENCNSDEDSGKEESNKKRKKKREGWEIGYFIHALLPQPC